MEYAGQVSRTRKDSRALQSVTKASCGAQASYQSSKTAAYIQLQKNASKRSGAQNIVQLSTILNTDASETFSVSHEEPIQMMSNSTKKKVAGGVSVAGGLSLGGGLYSALTAAGGITLGAGLAMGLGGLGLLGGLGYLGYQHLYGDDDGYEELDLEAGEHAGEGLGGMLHHGNMTQNRGLGDYRRALYNPQEGGVHGFSRVIDGLGAEDTWVDMGTGAGQALRDLYDQRDERAIPNMIGVLGERPDGFALDGEDIDDRLTYQERLLHEIEGNDVFGGDGNVSLITDYSGVASYTNELGETIDRYMHLLREGGQAIIRIQNTSGRAGWSDVLTLNDFRNGDGGEISPADWLQGGTGYEVNSHRGGNSWIVTLTRNGDDIMVPNINLDDYNDANQPPLRRFTAPGL